MHATTITLPRDDAEGVIGAKGAKGERDATRIYARDVGTVWPVPFSLSSLSSLPSLPSLLSLPSSTGKGKGKNEEEEEEEGYANKCLALSLYAGFQTKFPANSEWGRFVYDRVNALVEKKAMEEGKGTEMDCLDPDVLACIGDLCEASAALGNISGVCFHTVSPPDTMTPPYQFQRVDEKGGIVEIEFVQHRLHKSFRDPTLVHIILDRTRSSPHYVLGLHIEQDRPKGTMVDSVSEDCSYGSCDSYDSYGSYDSRDYFAGSESPSTSTVDDDELKLLMSLLLDDSV